MKLFKDQNLAVRLETTEGLSCEAYAKGNGILHPDQGNKSARIGGGIATFAGRHSPISQIFGFGIETFITPEVLEELEDFFFDEGCDVNIETCPFADLSVGHAIQNRGYFISEFSNVLVRDISSFDAGSETRHRVETVTDENAEAWTRVLTEGWSGSPDDSFVLDLARSMYVTDSYSKLLVYDGEEPAGAGCVFVSDDIALFFGHTTIRQSRGKGVQASLISASLDTARSASATLAMAVTVPGSISQRNFERTGFDLAYSRFKLTRVHG